MTDYIEREVAQKSLIDLPAELDAKAVQRCIETIHNLAAADVRPVVRGKWRPYSPLTDTYECDKCGYQVIDEIFRTNFCPDCGADMRPRQVMAKIKRGVDNDY